ncbi:MAG: hypothetical protein Q7S24_00140 [bacterium]|nr:hypothetical protein [bacterium]
MNKHKPKIFHKQNGFVVLFAVLVSSIVLAITLGIADVALKEIVFSSQANYSHVAFFAADTGLECGLFHDRIKSSFVDQMTGAPITSDFSIICDDQSITSTQPRTISGGPVTHIFKLNIPLTKPECAIITVTKNIIDEAKYPNAVGTEIESRGYNTDCAKISNKYNSHVVERVLQATYFEAVLPTPPLVTPLVL